MQVECLARYDFETYSEAYEAVTEFIHFYNERRIWDTRLAESTKRRRFHQDPVAYLKQIVNKFVS
ncbi:IS3 family transposase [Paenibacillus sp. NRS-1782]|uniref:IS3 family transposase n=1 Tax=unclassified Paenibacillus TaxID=185978 RepID=UPI003D29CB9B